MPNIIYSRSSCKMVIICQLLALYLNTFAINRKKVKYGNEQEVLLAKKPRSVRSVTSTMIRGLVIIMGTVSSPNLNLRTTVGNF